MKTEKKPFYLYMGLLQTLTQTEASHPHQYHHEL